MKLVTEQGLTLEAAAARMAIPAGAVANWAAAAQRASVGAVPGSRSAADLQAEIAKLRKELAEARMERDILKKATAYFARESLPGTRP